MPMTAASTIYAVRHEQIFEFRKRGLQDLDKLPAPVDDVVFGDAGCRLVMWYERLFYSDLRSN
jgi:hypothetical protein